jgi:hypothetical protein
MLEDTITGLDTVPQFALNLMEQNDNIVCKYEVGK